MNRYERLFGYMYSRLVQNLSDDMTSDKNDVVVASVLLFRSFNENLYYVGTHANPLLNPDEVWLSYSNDISERKYLTSRCLWYLAAYFCSKWGRAQINKVFEENNKLAELNASTFALTYPKYASLKEAWNEWLQKNSTNSWLLPPDDELSDHPLVRQSFVLSNLLLVTMPVKSTSKGGMSDNGSKTINNASDIVNLIMGGKPYTSRWTDSAGKFKTFQSEPFEWRYVKPGRKQLTYGELLNVIEFTLIQPVSGRNKEIVLERLVENSHSTAAFEPPEFKMSALARPLFYNCEFQGIVYVVKKYEQGTEFKSHDAKRFERKIRSLHIEHRLAESRYDLTQIALRSDHAIDTTQPSLFRILNILHLFTSACSGIVVFEDEENGLVAWERYRVSIGAGTQMKTTNRKDAQAIKDLLSDIAPASERPLWLFNEGSDLKALLTLPSNGEKTESKSAMVIPLLSEDNRPGYFLLFFRETNDFVKFYCFDDEEWGCSDEARNIYAERLYNVLDRLIDADREHKRTLNAVRERNLLRAHDLSLMTPHTAKNSFHLQMVQPLREALELITTNDARVRVERAMRYATRFAEQANAVSMAWRNILKLQGIHNPTTPGLSVNSGITVDPNDFKQICEKLKEENHRSERRSIVCRVREREGASISTSKEILLYLLDQLLANAIEASDDQEVPPEERKFEIRWTETSSVNGGSPVTVQISVWNANTVIYQPTVDFAGGGPMINIADGHSGLGLYFIESALSQLDALPYKNGKHFQIQNTSKPTKGVRVEFSFSGRINKSE